MRPKMVKLWMTEVGDDYEVRRNDEVVVGPTVQSGCSYFGRHHTIPHNNLMRK